MNSRDTDPDAAIEEWQRCIPFLINACGLRYPTLAKKTGISEWCIQNWGRSEGLESATLSEYVTLLTFFVQKRPMLTEANRELWAQVMRLQGPRSRDSEPHAFAFDTAILCNRAFMIAFLDRTGLGRSEAAKLIGVTPKYLSWATNPEKDPGELFYLSIPSYRQLLAIPDK